MKAWLLKILSLIFLFSQSISCGKIKNNKLMSNLRENTMFSKMRFQEKSKELSDEEKLDRINIELKFGENNGDNPLLNKDKEIIRLEANFYSKFRFV